MLKKALLALILMPLIFLSGCTLPWSKPITEIVYEEEKSINSLQEFLAEAQVIADKEIGSGAQAKIIYYSYFNDVFSYDVTFAKNGEMLKNNIIKNIVISYNKTWEVKKESSISAHVAKEAANNKIIAIECNKAKQCATGLANAMADPKNDIDISKIKIPLSTFIDDKYLTGFNYGFIKNVKGVPIGSFGRFRFNMITGDSFDGANDKLDKWYEDQVSSAPSSISSVPATDNKDDKFPVVETLNIDINSDFDKDGLYDIQELGYETLATNSDTDKDGFSDSSEVNSGYDPRGQGKLIPEKCSVSPNQEECYLKTGIINKDSSYCQNISSEKPRLFCIFSIGLINRDKDICKKISEIEGGKYEDSAKECFEYVLKEMKNIAQYNPPNPGAATVADIKQLQTAFELYYNDNNKYPPSSILSEGVIASGSTVYMAVIPKALKGTTPVCAENYEYKYTLINDNEYTLTYCLDKEISNIEAGIHIASPRGIK